MITLRGLKDNMSASREKQNRQANGADPKTAREAQQRKEEKRSNFLYGLIAVVFLAVVIISVVWRTNVIPRMATAASIDGENYNAAEVSYYYQSAYRNFVSNYSYFVSYLGLDTSISLKNQEINETAVSMLEIEDPKEGMTWYDYFMDQALENMAVIQTGLKAAAAENFSYPTSVQAQYDETMESLRTAAASSGASVSQYLSANFGGGITEKVYSEQLMRMLQYSAYATAYTEGLSYSDSELTEAYNANRNTYDHVAYEVVTLSGAAESTTDDDGNPVDPTEEESAAAMEAARNTMNALLDDFKDGGNLETLAEASEATYSENENGNYSAGSVLSEWLYDSARKDGDAAVLEDGTVLYVAVFHNRFRDEYATVNVRHILLNKAAATLGAEDEGYDAEQEQLTADAHAKAEEVLAQWQSGDATEDSFAALAFTESGDGGSRFNGGLYTRVYKGQMLETFNDWCFDASRKPGDTGLVDTTYGTHVMYYVGTDLPRWQAQVTEAKANEDYIAWEEGRIEGITPELHNFGMGFVD